MKKLTQPFVEKKGKACMLMDVVIFRYIYTPILAAIVGAESTESVSVLSFSRSRGSSSQLISVMNVICLTSLALFSQRAMHVYNVSSGAHYAHHIETTKILEFP